MTNNAERPASEAGRVNEIKERWDNWAGIDRYPDPSTGQAAKDVSFLLAEIARLSAPQTEAKPVAWGQRWSDGSISKVSGDQGEVMRLVEHNKRGNADVEIIPLYDHQQPCPSCAALREEKTKLETQVHMWFTRFNAMKSGKDAADVAIAELERNNESLAEDYTALHATYEAEVSTVIALRAELAAQATRIEELEAQVKEVVRQNALMRDVRKGDVKFLARMQTQLADRDARIEALNQQLDEAGLRLAHVLKESEARITAQAKQIEEMEALVKHLSPDAIGGMFQ